jgi:hypothetical protein
MPYLTAGDQSQGDIIYFRCPSAGSQTASGEEGGVLTRSHAVYTMLTEAVYSNRKK